MEFRWEIHLKGALTTIGIRMMHDCNKSIFCFKFNEGKKNKANVNIKIYKIKKS